jgi:proton-translocating NAD(P)+ transhydrogenase subunit alpha
MSDVLTIGLAKEADPAEKRVALVPAAVARLCKSGFQVLVQSDAGTQASCCDEAYVSKGATIVATRDELYSQADVILRIRALGACPESDGRLPLRSGQVLIASCDPLSHPDNVQQVASSGAMIFALELVPRITRAQSMDILSSMATVAGYRAVLLAATAAPRVFPMMMTAAGTLKPARVLVIGAGVAGLQAISTARRLGAVVFGYDIRPAVKEQVESLGAKFVELNVEADEAEGKGGYAKQMSEDFYRRQQEAMKKVIADCDIVITTAAIPGRKAPILVTTEMVEAMDAGSVIVDIAAERGGNCEVTQPGQTITHNGVTVIGPLNLPSDVPVHASEMFSRNIVTFLAPLVKDGQLAVDTDDEIVRDTLLVRDGEVVNARIRELLNLPELNAKEDAGPGSDTEDVDEPGQEGNG